MRLLSICLLLSATFLVQSNSKAASIVPDIKAMAEVNDDLGIRITLRKNFKTKMSTEDWEVINSILSKRPNVGFDLVLAWYKQVSIQEKLALPQNKLIQEELKNADLLMSSGDFKSAFKKYQLIAQTIKKQNKGLVPKENSQLYLNILHQTGRALYGAGEFNQAFEVYGWIPPTYYMYRQVMFEKMWSAFRANNINRTLGAIASQQSAFYSRYLDPESYLIKIYVLKKLCRDAEVKLTVESIKKYLADLKAERISSIEWAKTDLLRMSLANLISFGSSEARFNISKAERISEKRKIKQYLDKKFLDTSKELISRLERVVGYALLASMTSDKLLAPTANLPSSSELEKNGFEYWSDSSEEWVDEIGSHLFIGGSQCRGK